MAAVCNEAALAALEESVEAQVIFFFLTGYFQHLKLNVDFAIS